MVCKCFDKKAFGIDIKNEKIKILTEELLKPILSKFKK